MKFINKDDVIASFFPDGVPPEGVEVIQIIRNYLINAYRVHLPDFSIETIVQRENDLAINTLI
ncbi:hypothetical protein ASD55_11340 [Rhodanobacter sp. Root561]|nr:hypothetical protein ASD55_11340 [Rhodanobacter sp. Root561]